jgi:hypothetical protein
MFVLIGGRCRGSVKPSLPWQPAASRVSICMAAPKQNMHAMPRLKKVLPFPKALTWP